jgi:hypothetical protein
MATAYMLGVLHTPGTIHRKITACPVLGELAAFDLEGSERFARSTVGSGIGALVRPIPFKAVILEVRIKNSDQSAMHVLRLSDSFHPEGLLAGGVKSQH